MSTVVFLNKEFADNPLRRRQDASGKDVPGEFEANGLRLRHTVAGWELFVPLLPMGESVYQEHAGARPDGTWTLIGIFPSQAAGQRAAIPVTAGAKVWRAKYRDLIGTVPPQLVDRAIAERELQQHIAPRGAGF